MISKRIVESTEDAMDAKEIGPLCLVCRDTSCWTGCYRYNPFTRLSEDLSRHRVRLPHYSYWHCPRFTTTIAAWSIRMLNSFIADPIYVKHMELIAMYLRNDIRRVAGGQHGHLCSGLGSESEQDLEHGEDPKTDICLGNARDVDTGRYLDRVESSRYHERFTKGLMMTLARIERDFLYISRGITDPNELHPGTSLDEPAKPKAQQPIRNNLEPRKSPREKKTKRKFDDEQEEPESSLAKRTQRTKPESPARAEKPTAKQAPKPARTSKSKKSNPKSPKTGGPIKIHESLSPSVSPSASKPAPVTSQNPAPLGELNVTATPQPIPGNPTTGETGLATYPPSIAPGLTPSWAEVYEPNSLSKMGLVPGTWNTIYNPPRVLNTLPSIPEMCQAILERIPGHRMTAKAAYGMVKEWSNDTHNRKNSIKEQMGHKNKVDKKRHFRSYKEGGLNWWCLTCHAVPL